MRKWLYIVDGAIIWSIIWLPSNLWTSIDTVEEEFFSFSLLRCCVLSEDNWRPASGHGQYYSSACDMICYYGNKWLPAIPISSILTIFTHERGNYSVFFLPTSFIFIYQYQAYQFIFRLDSREKTHLFNSIHQSSG